MNEKKQHTDAEILDWIGEHQVIEGLGLVLEDIHEYAMVQVTDPDKEAGPAEYRLAIRRMLSDAMHVNTEV